MAEIELSALSKQCLDRRIADMKKLPMRLVLGSEIGMKLGQQ